MTPTRWHRIQALFDAVLDASPDERSAVLDGVAADERAEIEALLRADAAASVTFLGVPAAERAASLVADLVEEADQVASDDPDGVRLGPWRLLGEIGRGGMGLVYEGERADGLFKQSVAIKIVRHAGPNLVRRFEHERKALARLNHPNVAHLVDAGRTDDGRPFFVMEYVEGEPITAYAEARDLGVADRLLLMEQVCEAVHHAHQHLLVHRDLKPSNVLVTPEGRVKLLDFGIARLLETEAGSDDPSDALPLTRPDFRIMTPEYAAPEQVRGETVTTAADVYALGVLLYELLAGKRPYEVRGRTPAEVERLVCQHVPALPSTVLRQAAREEVSVSRDVEDATRFARRVRGDLDRIVMQALRKAPADRYASAEQLGEDLRNFMAGLPVSARPDSSAYRIRLFARRRPGLVGAALAAVVALVALAVVSFGFAATTAQQNKAISAALERAEFERSKAEATGSFLLDIFRVANPQNGGTGETVSARSLLDAGFAEAQRDLDGQPMAAASFMHTIGLAYLNLGALDRAEIAFRHTDSIYAARLAEDHPMRAVTRNALGQLAWRQGAFDEAQSRYREGLAQLTPTTASDSATFADLLDGLGLVLQEQGHYAEATPFAERGLAIRYALTSTRPDKTGSSLHHLALIRRHQGDLPAADSLFALARGILEPLTEQYPLLLAATYSESGGVRSLLGKPAQADSLARLALALRREHLPAAHPDLALTLNDLGAYAMNRGDLNASLALHTEALAIRRIAHGPTHPEVAQSLNNLALLYDAQGRPAEGFDALTQAAEALRQSLGPEHPSTLTVEFNRATWLFRRGRVAEADALMRDIAAIQERTLGPDHPDLGRTYQSHAALLKRTGQYEESAAQYVKALAIRRTALGDDHLDVGRTLASFAGLEHERGRHAESVALLSEARGIFGARNIADRLARAYVAEAICLRDQGLDAEARALLLDGETALAGTDFASALAAAK